MGRACVCRMGRACVCRTPPCGECRIGIPCVTVVCRVCAAVLALPQVGLFVLLLMALSVMPALLMWYHHQVDQLDTKHTDLESHPNKNSRLNRASNKITTTEEAFPTTPPVRHLWRILHCACRPHAYAYEVASVTRCVLLHACNQLP